MEWGFAIYTSRLIAHSVFSFQVEKNVLFSDNILYKAANATAVLPQYHPKHLTALMNLGKMRRVRAILCHLVNFLLFKYFARILKELGTS